MTVRKNNRAKEQGAETKKLLYECADQLFQQRNFADVSVEAITRMAGVTKGTFYVHFASKNALYVELFSAYAERMDAQYEAFLDALPPEMPSSDRTLVFVEKIIDLMMAQIGYNRLQTIYRLQLTNTTDTEVVMGYGRRLYVLFREVRDPTGRI